MSETQPQALVVEDNRLVREGIAELLRRRGFDVSMAENGEKALLDLRKEPPPAVIILDMLMPVVDGWHFLAEMRNLRLNPSPWIIVTTGSPAIDRAWAADHGCGGFLRKPVEEKRLAEEIKRCLDRTTEIQVEQ
jgi:two-component system, OmpR family, response regulator CpxR